MVAVRPTSTTHKVISTHMTMPLGTGELSLKTNERGQDLSREGTRTAQRCSYRVVFGLFSMLLVAPKMQGGLAGHSGALQRTAERVQRVGRDLSGAGTQPIRSRRGGPEQRDQRLYGLHLESCWKHMSSSDSTVLGCFHLCRKHNNNNNKANGIP